MLFDIILTCIKIQIYKNQAYSVFTFKMVEIIVLLGSCLPPSPGIKSFSVPLGCNILLTSIFEDDRIAYTENPKGLGLFVKHVVKV